ncbi:MAG TPA: prepilin-type N-terminal cleavage/methylation domain-containing protein [Syntrophomonadaceae bacterium]|nr:prepilin-type N-terminal cleavage/methylation domain-containing protein [Syntrophomonadaceae bacterium]
MLNLKKYLRSEKGFTMIEMMVVLIIIAVLIAGGIKFYLGYIENSRVAKAKAQISTMQAALDAYYSENGAYPVSQDELLNAGMKASSTTSSFTLDTKDPWGQNYKYVVSSKNDSCVVYTGYSNVQKQSGYVVAAECKNGELIDPPGIRITNDTDPDGNAE